MINMFRVGPSLLLPGQRALVATRALSPGTVLFREGDAWATLMNDADIDLVPLTDARQEMEMEEALDRVRARYAAVRQCNCVVTGEQVCTAVTVEAGSELTRRYGWGRWLKELGAMERLLTTRTLAGFMWHAARHAEELDGRWAEAALREEWIRKARAAKEEMVQLLYDEDTGKCELAIGQHAVQ